jgi:opacity protein-like surface antigen
MRILMTLVAFALFGAIGTANAADLNRPSTKDAVGGFAGSDTPAIHKGAFAGAYFGASISWQNMEVEHGGELAYGPFGLEIDGQKLPYETFAKGGLADLSEQSFRVGIQAGYNWQFGRLYGGPRLAVDFGEVEAGLSRVDTLFDNGEDFNVSHHGKLSISSDFLATASLKLGVALTDNVGVYGVGGVSVADVDMNASGKIVASDDGHSISGLPWQAANSETMVGYHIGAGVDFVLNDWNAFLEYTYHDLGSIDSNGTIYGGLIAYEHSADVTFNVIKAGINRRF